MIAEIDRTAHGGRLEHDGSTGLVFTSLTGTGLDAANVRRAFDGSCGRPGWTRGSGRRASCGTASCPCSPTAASIEDIADLCGHSGTLVTEKIYRHQLRPVLLTGAVLMDRIFSGESGA